MISDYVYSDISRTEVVPSVPFSAVRVLDVGCGMGGFGDQLRARRPAPVVWGVEAHEGAARLAAERYDRVLVGTFPAVMNGIEERFDCIVFNDVLEHTVDPWAVLRTARKWLARGGVVVASIPNVRYWPVLRELAFKGRWEYRDEGVLDRTHLRFFTRTTMLDLFATAGFEVYEIRSVNEQRASRALRLIRLARPALAADLAAKQYVLAATAVTD